MRKTFIRGEQQVLNGKSQREGTWQGRDVGNMGKQLWLNRFGGPGMNIETAPGDGLVVVREDGVDGRGYLMVLI